MKPPWTSLAASTFTMTLPYTLLSFIPGFFGVTLCLGVAVKKNARCVVSEKILYSWVEAPLDAVMCLVKVDGVRLNTTLSESYEDCDRW